MRKLILLALIIVGVGFISFNYTYPNPKQGLELGNQVPNISGKLINGEDFDLETLRGSMVLIDFWASYDGASRSENYLKEDLQIKYANTSFYRGKGLIIVSVSLDRFKSPLKKAIEEDGYVKALHLCDYQGLNSVIAQSYKVQKPVKYLIDGEGRLVAKTTRLDDVEAELAYLSRYHSMQ